VRFLDKKGDSIYAENRSQTLLSNASPLDALSVEVG